MLFFNNINLLNLHYGNPVLSFSLTRQMCKDSFVAIAANIEEAIHFRNVVSQTGCN